MHIGPKDMDPESKWANELHYAVKGHLIPIVGINTVDSMVKSYTQTTME